MEYWRRQRLKEIMKHIVVVVLIVAACIGIIAGIRKYYDQFYLKTEVKVVEVINKEISNLREKGTKIYKEEIDLGNSYQIIIRIDK